MPAPARSNDCSGRDPPAPEPVFTSLLAEPVLTRPGDWSGYEHALKHPPEELLEAVKAADVRGRGGAGFPAGTKWQFARNAPGADKVIVANGDEGDPGSYMGKLLMEDNPHLLLEGMALAGYAVGAAHGFVLVRSEYPRSKPALEQAIDEARARGHLGDAFDITVVEGAGSYVVGEETALLSCLQGLRGTVSARPPFPAERGVHGLPTVVNNVETLVGIAGAPGPVASCTTVVRDGMTVDTTDETARRVATAVVELVLSELPARPADHTELAQVARMLDVGEPRWPGSQHTYDHDERHPYLAFQHELCISCGRCVRACDEVQGTFALTATGRGFGANIAAGLDQGFRDSACVSCGACADTRPTDAITEISLLHLAR